jgi:hypothetical protein
MVFIRVISSTTGSTGKEGSANSRTLFSHVLFSQSALAITMLLKGDSGVVFRSCVGSVVCGGVIAV